MWGIWEEVISVVQGASNVLQQIAGSPQCRAVQRALLSRVSDTTAFRYLTTCVQFLIMVRELGWELANLTAVQMVDAVFALRLDPESKLHATNTFGGWPRRWNFRGLWARLCSGFLTRLVIGSDARVCRSHWASWCS